jgi:hypothetical protein
MLVGSVGHVVDAAHKLWVAALIITVTGSWSFVWFCNFPMLLEFTEMLDLRFAEFCELFMELQRCFGLLSHQVTVQGTRP